MCISISTAIHIYAYLYLYNYIYIYTYIFCPPPPCSKFFLCPTKTFGNTDEDDMLSMCGKVLFREV